MPFNTVGMTFTTGLSNPQFQLPGVPTGPNVRNNLASQLTPGVFDPRTFSQTRIPTNFGPDKVHAWSFGFEREIAKRLAWWEALKARAAEPSSSEDDADRSLEEASPGGDDAPEPTT